MKKLFSIFFVLALLWSGNVYAQTLDYGTETNKQTDETNLIAGRNNAPQATYTYHFSFDEDGSIETQYFFRGSRSGLTAITQTDIIWLPLPNSETIQMQFSMGYGSSAGQTNYGQVMCPPVGTYTIVTTASSMNTTKMWAGGDLTYGSISSGTYRGYYYNVVADNLSQSGDINTTGYADSWISYDGSSSTNFKSGTFTVEKGRHGYPYMYSTSLKDVNSNTLNITINDSRNLNTSYTSAEIATDNDNKKVAMFAYNGSDNRMNLIFDVASIDANIGIPAGTYTIGTNVFGEIFDTDGYTTWTLTSGTITITKSGSRIGMSVSSLRGNDNDGTSRTLTLSMSNVTPTVTAATSITSTNGTMSVPSSNSWYQIWGFDKDNGSYGMKVSVYKGVVPNGNVATANSANYNLSDVAYTKITRPAGDIQPNTNYIVSNLYYDKRYKSGKAYIAMKGTDGQFYMATIYSTKWYSSSQMYMEYDKTSSFGPQNFAMLDVDEDDDEPGTYSITGNTGTYQISLARFHGGEGDGLIPSGEYDINPACFTNSLYIGGYDLNSAGTALDMLWGSYVYQNSSNVWFLRSGTVTVTNIDETYYVNVQARNSRVQSEQETYSVQYTLGTAPKSLTFNSDANGSVAASFNATNWGKTITDYAEGTAYPFFTGQTITLTPTPASSDYEFDSWTASGATPVDNGNGTWNVTIASSNVTLTANFRAAVSNYTVTYNKGTYGTGSAIADDTKTGGINLTLSSSTYTRTGYTQTGWSINSNGSTKDYNLGGTYSTDANLDLYPYWTINTYTVTIAKNEDEWGTVSQASVTDVPYGTTFTVNGSTITINGNNITASPTASNAQYTYAFSSWTNGAATVTGNMTVTANFTRTVNTYDITFKNADGTTLKKSDGTTDAVYSVVYGETPVYDGATPTKAADSEYTYTFNAWTPAIATVTTAATYTATYSTNKVQYTLTWDVNGGNALTGTYTNGTIDWGTAITKPADPTKSGYTFNGWDADNDGTADNVAATMPTNNVTYKALWTAASPNITLCENCDNSHYNTFKATYSGSAGVGVNVTYKRQFTAERWSTMCLPFSLDLATMIANKMYGCVYEFKYATGNANVGSGVNLYFSNAKNIEAGKCYIVNANDALAEKTSFVFSGVTIDLSKDNGAALDSEDAYDDLPGYKSQGTIELVGTLRNGTLQGSAKDNTYMGLKNNKIYYPNTTAPGSTIWAYRGIFRSSEILDKESMQKMRIIVDGEDRGELFLDADGDILAPSDAQSRKFFENGVLYIEREGVIYDAQGKRIK